MPHVIVKLWPGKSELRSQSLPTRSRPPSATCCTTATSRFPSHSRKSQQKTGWKKSTSRTFRRTRIPSTRSRVTARTTSSRPPDSAVLPLPTRTPPNSGGGSDTRDDIPRTEGTSPGAPASNDVSQGSAGPCLRGHTPSPVRPRRIQHLRGRVAGELPVDTDLQLASGLLEFPGIER